MFNLKTKTKETKDTKEVSSRKKVLSGTVVSDKMDKTLVVLVSRFVKHPKYGKFMKRSKRLKVHDENNAFSEGDKVTIEQTRPYSKEKFFKVVSKEETK